MGLFFTVSKISLSNSALRNSPPLEGWRKFARIFDGVVPLSNKKPNFI
jgi:hypothetical protein